MIQATARDRATLQSILYQSFRENNHTNWLASGSTRPCEQIRPLIDYTIDDGLLHGQIFLTDCRNGAAIWKRYPARAGFWNTAALNVGLLRQLGLRPLPRLLKTESYVERQRPSTPYLYLWMLGVRPHAQGQGLSSRLLDPMLAAARQEGLPVLLETSLEKNVQIYSRKGFSVYHEYRPDPASDLHIRFMKAAP